MSAYLGLFSNNILPIFLAAGAGFLLAKFLHVQPRQISQIAFYIFSPCLLFSILTKSQLNSADVTRMAGFTITIVVAIGILTWILARFMRLERRMLAAVLITAMFSNSGNYGLSLNLFAFGEDALAYASLYFVIVAILTYTLGVVVASMGSASLGQAFWDLRKVPAIYAVTLALIFIAAGLKLPLFLDRTVSLLGEAAIPLLMVLMGIQLAHATWDGQTRALSLTSFMRLIAGPALALSMSLLFGLQGAARQAGVIESAMPTAIVTTVLATEYDVEPSFVSTVVFISTLLSPLTVTPLLAYLGA